MSLDIFANLHDPLLRGTKAGAGGYRENRAFTLPEPDADALAKYLDENAGARTVVITVERRYSHDCEDSEYGECECADAKLSGAEVAIGATPAFAANALAAIGVELEKPPTDTNPGDLRFYRSRQADRYHTTQGEVSDTFTVELVGFTDLQLGIIAGCGIR